MNPRLDNWCELPTPMGVFRMYDLGDESVRLVCRGEIHDQGPMPLFRMHSSCLASEVFGAVDCDCSDQLRDSMKLIAAEGRGLVIHLNQEGRGQGLSRKIRAVGLMQRKGLDTFEAFESLGLEQDPRTYGAAIAVLRHLDIRAVRLISNNPRKARFLEQHGVRVTSVRTHPVARSECGDYLKTKRDKLGHALQIEAEGKGKDHDNIRFYHSDQPWGELSNFSRHAVYLKSRVWPTVEHFYQAQKFADKPEEERIRRCSTPMLAKELATELASAYKRADWPAAMDEVMLEGLRAKFRQHPDLAEMLRRSGDRTLIEHTRNDSYWGDGGDGSGKNRLGHLLMQVRAELHLAVDREQVLTLRGE
jgi:GTP cyclohydrolase II